MSKPDVFDPARDVVQAAVTAILHSDRKGAGDMLTAFGSAAPTNELAMALTAIDLVVHVHLAWAQAIGMDADQAHESWAELLLDIETWRALR